MTFPCPSCCPFPKMCKGPPFPMLGEEVAGLRKCPVCLEWFNAEGEVSSFKDTKDEPYDGSNPGQHHTKYWYPSLNKRR